METSLKVMWNKNKLPPPPTFQQTICIKLETSIDIASLSSYLEEIITGMLRDIATQTGAEEKFLSIEHKTLNEKQ